MIYDLLYPEAVSGSIYGAVIKNDKRKKCDMCGTPTAWRHMEYLAQVCGNDACVAAASVEHEKFKIQFFKMFEGLDVKIAQPGAIE